MVVTAIERKGKELASKFVPAPRLTGDDERDAVLLRKMSEEAGEYIRSFSWCKGVLGSYFAGGIGGIFAIFFFHIRPSRPDVDPWIWIVVGDVPPAYLPLSDCNSPSDVFSTYVEGMRRWVELARLGKTGTPEQGVPPVNVPSTPEWAENLNKRLQNLELLIRPVFGGKRGRVN